MDHVAIDLASRESQICIRRADGTIREEKRLRTAHLPEWMGTLPRARVVMEACSEAFAIADAARSAGHDVRVVPGTLVRALGVGARGVKTDIRDARALSEASCRIEVPTVHVPSHDSRDAKTLCGMREALVQMRTMGINTVRGYLRTTLVSVRTGAPETFPQRVREGFDEVPKCVQRQLLTIEMLTDQIADADRELVEVAKSSKVCQRLMTIPGVGPTTAVRFEATVDDVRRFRSGHALMSYLGLTPGERSSGDKRRTTGITKAGPNQLRGLLVQCAWTFLRTRGSDPAAEWALKVMERRGRQIGIIALARKLAGIMFALWRKEESYRPKAAGPRRQIVASGLHVAAEARR